MARSLGSTQRVVRSIPDRSGHNYTKTSAGGKARAASATRYMDEKERTQLYTLEDGLLRETERVEAAARIEDTTTKYQQHLVFTTQLPGEAEVDRQRAALLVAQAVQERRPDAEIYAVAVHQQDGGNVHVHICFGTDTTLRRGPKGIWCTSSTRRTSWNGIWAASWVCTRSSTRTGTITRARTSNRSAAAGARWNWTRRITAAGHGDSVNASRSASTTEAGSGNEDSSALAQCRC
ncbi:hypothetical protein ACFP9V_26745 [Deinococcus radiopugnans]